MAGAAVTKVAEHHPDSLVEALRLAHNKLVDDVEALRNFCATHTHTGANPVGPTAGVLLNTVDAAADMTGNKVNKLQ